MGNRIIINTAETTDKGILITSMSVIDDTGSVLKIAALNKELADFLCHVEIEVYKYFEIQELIKKNPAVKLLIDTFNLNI